MSLSSIIKKISYSIHQLFLWSFPPTCLFCTNDTTSDNVCHPCRQSLPFLSQNCKQCAQSLPANLSLLCGTCLKNPPPFDRTLAVFIYRPPIIRLITLFKFHESLADGAALSGLLLQKIQQDWYKDAPLPQAIIPIPLHRKRLQERGFNQALELAKPLAKTLKIPLILKGITRHKITATQSTLPASIRKKNVKDAFSITASLPVKHIAVIDDVITTGHTMREFCQQLKLKGIEQIDVWCCAIVPVKVIK